MANSQDHKQRKHSKFSASGAERWMSCPGSVQISEGLPDKDSVWSVEGTRAHEVLERILVRTIEQGLKSVARKVPVFDPTVPREMIIHGISAADFILRLWSKHEHADIMVENRVYLSFIHPEMFGTFDGAVIDHFGTLHVFDYKYGAGHAVGPRKNLQMIFYGIGLAHKFHWNFKRVRLWIIQPRIKGYDGPAYWDIPVMELKSYVEQFEQAVDRVLKHPTKFAEGAWCHWCKAKAICPLKTKARAEKAIAVFTAAPYLFGEPTVKYETNEKEK